jgi:hypothetical protein
MDNSDDKSKKGFLSKVWKAHTTLAKYAGATLAKTFNPQANLLDVVTQLWSMMGKTAAEFFVPGWSIIGGELGNVATGAFNLVSGAMSSVSPLSVPALTP